MKNIRLILLLSLLPSTIYNSQISTDATPQPETALATPTISQTINEPPALSGTTEDTIAPAATRIKRPTIHTTPHKEVSAAKVLGSFLSAWSLCAFLILRYTQ